MLLPLLTLLASLTTPARAGEDDLVLHVDPVDVPATVDVPLDTLLWVNLRYKGGPTEAVAEVLGDDLANCPDLRSELGFRPRDARDLFRRDLLRYAVVEVTAEQILVGGVPVMPLEDGDTPERLKEGVILRPLMDALLKQAEAQYQFQLACKDPAWTSDGTVTSGSSGRLLVAVAPDVPFDVLQEVLVTARKARFKIFYLHARSRKTVSDPLPEPPSVGDATMRVFVASDGGLGIDSQEEGQDTASLLIDYLPSPAGTRSARVVPYPASPFAYVVSGSGALLSKGWEPALLARFDKDDLRATRQAPVPRTVERRISARRSVQAVPVTLPEGAQQTTTSRREVSRTRFTITGDTPHVATFTPPAHLADALNRPDVYQQLNPILTCYRDEEADTEGLAGELVLQLQVGPSGTVTSVSLLPTSTVEDVHLRRCTVDTFRELTLPSVAVTPEPMLWTVALTPGDKPDKDDADGE